MHADNAQLADFGVRDGGDDAVVIAADAAGAFVVRATLDGNAGDGVELAGTTATIGGPSQADTIVRNDGAGVRVLAGASGTVSENKLGVTALVAAGNGTGVVLGSAQVSVFTNQISENLGDGVVMSACGQVTGNSVEGNDGSGIVVTAPSCQVGGPLGGNGNLVSGNGGDGIRATANGVTIQGNRLGTIAGGPGTGNGGDGIEVTGDSPTIGGPSAYAGNWVASSGGDGIRLAGSDNAVVVGNVIFSNTGHGVSVDGVAGDLATLGTAGLGVNQIYDNGGDGVSVTGAATARIRDDSFRDNGGLGIDLGDDGVTANDALDADSGPNSLQNFPVLTSVRRDTGRLRVKGSISVPASGLVQIDVFESTDCTAGVGEGAALLGTINLAVAGAGNATFNQTIEVDRPAGTDVTAIATRGDETSEFSACAEVAEAPSTTVTLTPASQSAFEGGTADFTVHRSGDTSGSADVSWSTHPGSATAPADYAVAGGTVHFAAGDADEPISVAIAQDGEVEPDESFTVTLDGVTNATGTEIGDPSTGTVTIRNQDNDLFVVTNGGDDPDAAIDGVCARAGGGCTLRAAIQEANGDAVPDRDAIVVDDAITNIQLGNTPPFPVIDEPLILSGEIATGRATIDGNDVAGLTIDAGAAQQTQIFDVNLLDAPLDVIGSDAVLQDADVSGAAGAGVRFRSGSTGAVGGAPGHGNRIFGNGGDGVLLDGSTDVNVSHNRIGVDGANALDGIRSSDSQAQVFANTISGNGGAGLRLLACADVVTDNRIGTQADGTGAVPNGVGVVVAAAGCQIGGSGADDGNTIAGNTGDGILVEAAGAVVLGNTIRSNGGAGVRSPGAGAFLRGNSITANGGLGIDTGAAGVSGGAPQLTAVVRESGKLHVTGTVPAPTAGQYDLEFTTGRRVRPQRLRRGRHADRGQGDPRRLTRQRAIRPRARHRPPRRHDRQRDRNQERPDVGVRRLRHGEGTQRRHDSAARRRWDDTAARGGRPAVKRPLAARPRQGAQGQADQGHRAGRGPRRHRRDPDQGQALLRAHTQGPLQAQDRRRTLLAEDVLQGQRHHDLELQAQAPLPARPLPHLQPRDRSRRQPRNAARQSPRQTAALNG